MWTRQNEAEGPEEAGFDKAQWSGNFMMTGEK